ncbi:MAG TPA: 7TM domain-containing protein [Patescibacteria group bacterium]|nr:7TM domain-containing protein [Patescibacteria group bacterium]
MIKKFICFLLIAFSFFFVLGKTNGLMAQGQFVWPIPPEQRGNLTEPQVPLTELDRALNEQQLGSLGITNFFKHVIHRAVVSGVPVNTIVLILLLPILVAVIAALRHLVGIRGFGIFTPTMISVALYATGIIPGLFLFFAILAMTNFGRFLLRKIRIRIHYLPRMALLFWFISLAVLLVVLFAPLLEWMDIAIVSIFPILILILLSEAFIDVQKGRSLREAVKITIETLILAFSCFGLMKLQILQKFVLLNPELTLIIVPVFDILIGRYTGIRLLELFRFRRVLKEG